MQTTRPESSRPIVRSPAVSPSRPLSIRHLSADINTYIDMYGLDEATDNGTEGPAGTMNEYAHDDFIYSGDVDQELRNLQNLRRISLDVSKLDPDVPSQNYELSPALTGQTAQEESDVGSSLYWVPARIHPEIAPQEWQSFVQKKEFRSEGASPSGVLKVPSIGKGLSRSKSLLSQEVNEKAADKYTDAGPELERRRSRLQSSIQVAHLGSASHSHQASEVDQGRSRNTIDEESLSDLTSDAPILVPPPGQILRRAARTGKAKGSYRKFAKPKSDDPPSSEIVSNISSEPTNGSSHLFESETIQLRADAPGYILSSPDRPIDLADAATPSDAIVERKKSRNRAMQIVGPKSPTEEQTSSDPFTSGSTKIENTRKPDIDGLITQPFITRLHPFTEYDRATTQPPNALPVQSEVDSKVRPDLVHHTPALQDTVIRQQKSTIVSQRPALVANTPVEVADMPTKDQISRPGLKRELSAASLTRAVMSGTAPTPSAVPGRNYASSPDEHRIDSNTSATSTGKKSAWNKLFSSDDREKSKIKKDHKATVSKMKRSPSQEEKSGDTGPTSLFTSIFGVKKREKESTSEPVRREITPTPKSIIREPHFYSRYPIQLERAIYRMAHLKLGNSRRPLFHQVLLSNFMYGYLALVGANTSGQAQGPSSSKRGRSHSPIQKSTTTKDETTARSSDPAKAVNHIDMTSCKEPIRDEGKGTNHETVIPTSSDGPSTFVRGMSDTHDRPPIQGTGEKSTIGKYGQSSRDQDSRRLQRVAQQQLNSDDESGYGIAA